MDDDTWIDDAWIDEVLESSSHLSHRESRREKPRAEAEVIDVDADDATLAEQLSKTLNQAEVLGLTRPPAVEALGLTLAVEALGLKCTLAWEAPGRTCTLAV